MSEKTLCSLYCGEKLKKCALIAHHTQHCGTIVLNEGCNAFENKQP